MPPTSKTWRLVPHSPDAAHGLARALRVSPVVAQLLANRGVTDPAAARAFLDCPLNHLHPPASLPGALEAAEVLARACAAGDKVCVYGDYDVDGTTGTAVLTGLLGLAGADAEFYIPNRRAEGYGLNADAVRQIVRDGAKVIVTVDCGVSALREAEVAREAGVTLIVTDHHEFQFPRTDSMALGDSPPGPLLPRAAAVVHPRLPAPAGAGGGGQSGGYPNPHLSGAGVAFKLAWAVAQRVSGRDKVLPRFSAYLLDALAPVALGLVADVVPLTGENRVIVAHGLKRLVDAPSVGLKALLEAAGLGDKAKLSAEDIGYRLGPRLNAAGRLECARQVVELLTTRNPVRARELAERLEELNTRRQGVERAVTQEAKDMVEAGGLAAGPAIVVAGAGWNQGVVGIVASRLADAYGRPALVVGLSHDDPSRPGAGSGRSVRGFPLHLALAACGAHLESHGGHAAAAGFKVRPENVEHLRAAFNAYAAAHFPEGVPPPELSAESEVPLSAVTLGLLNDLDRLEPYGCGNTRPTFLAAGLTLVDTPRRIGRDEKHLSFRVRQGDSTIRAVAWGMGDRLDELVTGGGQCCLMFTPTLNEWNGNRSVEVKVADFRAGVDPRLGT